MDSSTKPDSWIWIAALTALYFLGNGLMLMVGDALFWDGHSLVQRFELDRMRTLFEKLGSPITPYIHELYLGHSVFLGRLLTFVAHLFAGLLVFKITRYVAGIGVFDRFVLAALFLVLPFNYARVAIIDLPYAVYLCVFMAAWLVWCAYEQRGLAWLRIVAIALFLVSFSTKSLLVFYMWPFLMAWKVSGKSAANFLLTRIDFVVAPFVFYALFRVFLTPSAEYAGYNSPHLSDVLVSGPIAFLWSSFVYLDANVAVLLFCVCVCMVLLAYLSSRVAYPTVGSALRYSSFTVLLVGICVTASAFAPYLLVGKYPLYQGWASRHQLLLPLGVAIIMLALLLGWLREIRGHAAAVVLGICIATNMSSYWQYVVDAIKQDAIVEWVKGIDEVENGTYFPVTDNTWYFNAFRRQYNLVEFDSLFKRSFQDGRNRYALVRNYSQHEARSNEEFAALLEAARIDYLDDRAPIHPADFDCELIINPGSLDFSVRQQIQLSVQKFVSRERYRSVVSKLFDIRCV